MKRKLFLKNAATLTVTSLLLRTVGIVFRMYLSNKIGAEGMGLYQLIVSIYVLGSTFATSGVSTAVTRLVADELTCGTPRSIRHILRRSLCLSVGIGALSTAVIYVCADPIGRWWIRDLRAVPALRVLAFSLPSMGVSSCLRGYFVARRRVGTNARAQLAEQAVRMILIFFIIDRFAAHGLAAACAAVMIGDTIAEWSACGYVAIGYAIDRRRLQRESVGVLSAKPRNRVVRQLLSIAAPITAGRYLNTALRTVENILVPNAIAQYCGSQERGLSQFGALKGMALPLIFFPASFLSAMATLLIPELSADNAQHRVGAVRRTVEKALSITLFSSIWIGAVFTVFARPLGLIFYGSEDVGIYLRVLAPLTPIMYTESMVDGMLKGLNQQVSSLKYSIADSTIRILLIWMLVPYRGMGGFLFIMVISNVLTSFLNLRRLLTVTQLRFSTVRLLLKPLLCAVCAAVTSACVTQLPLVAVLPSVATVVIGGAVLTVVYGVLLLLTGTVRRENLKRKLKTF